MTDSADDDRESHRATVTDLLTEGLTDLALEIARPQLIRRSGPGRLLMLGWLGMLRSHRRSWHVVRIDPTVSAT